MYYHTLFYLLVALAASVLAVDDIDDYDYGSGSSHYVEPALKELVTGTARCLPPEVTAQMSAWLLRMNVLTQHRMLHAVAVQRLIREMEAGQSLCAALPLALRRMYSKHKLSLAQRAALETARGRSAHRR